MRVRESFTNIKVIFGRELAGYFNSAVAYVLLFFFLMVVGFFTFYISRFYEAGQADLRSFFQWFPWIFMILIPAVAMRLWAEERRLGTIELILTFPVAVYEVIFGKFLAAWVFIGIGLVLTFPMVLTTIYLGQPDLGAVFCGYVGSFLLAGGMLSVGCMTSSLSRSQVISFIIAAVLCLVFVLAGFPPVTNVLSDWAPIWLVKLVAGSSFLTHYISMERGVIDIRDIVYYLSVIFFMLFVNALIIQSRKAS